MEEGMLFRLWEDRWRLLTWLLPSIILMVFANLAVIPLISHLKTLKGKVVELRENTYEAAWFDSTQRDLRTDVNLLKKFQSAREAALTSDSNIQMSIDRIRGLAKRTGIELTKTTPVLSRVESLRLLKVQVEGYARYVDLIEFCDTLRVHHPDIFLEELLLRQGRERADGRLETHLVLYEYDRKQGEQP
jgi:hypothetical protein